MKVKHLENKRLFEIMQIGLCKEGRSSRVRCRDVKMLSCCSQKKGTPAKEGRWPLEAGGGKEMDSTLEP